MTLPTNEQQELDIQQRIFDCIENFNSFRFNAGAGAGKTFALVETIKHILKTKLVTLQRYNQQVVCITYTNVAVNEIKERLGLSDAVIVSTIHETLWELIKLYQKELIALHKEKIEQEIKSISNDLADHTSKFQKYARLQAQERDDFTSFVIEKKDIFYKHADTPSAEFRSAYNSLIGDKPDCLTDMLRNVSQFRDTVKHIYRKAKYQDCLERMADGKETKIQYDSKTNSDRLEYMKFSHDTLLEYGFKLVDKHPILRRIITDKYPYFFIDEYQDTNEQVIKSIKKLFDFSLDNQKPWLVGYFGDTAQNIYDDGVGYQIKELHDNVESIDKVFNRRSHSQIIDVINKIRNDSIKQKPIFPDRNLGNVNFYYSTCEDDDEKKTRVIAFLDRYKQDLDAQNIPTTIHCLVLTNKLMAQLNGFGDIYNVISEADTIYWNELNIKLLSHDTEKLHPTILLIYKSVMLHRKLYDNTATYYDILGELHSRVFFSDVNRIISDLKIITATNLDDFINELSLVLNNPEINQALRISLLKSLSIRTEDINAAGSLQSFIIRKLRELMYKNNVADDDETVDEELTKVQDLLNINMEQWVLWSDFINKNENKDIVYHTYHGTKGEEYENVAIIMGHSFGGHLGRDKFKSFFEHIQLETSDQDIKLEDLEYREKFENTKNLIYVACSRAIKNLRIFYLDDIHDIECGIKKIFGTVTNWESK